MSQQQLSQEQVLGVLTSALTAFRELDPDITAARILTLLSVVRNPGMQQLDLGQHVKGLSTSAISRNVLDWSNFTSARKPGPDFITQAPDPMFRKRNLLYPTVKGLQWVEQMTKKVAEQTRGLFA